MELILIPAGEFMMGAIPQDRDVEYFLTNLLFAFHKTSSELNKNLHFTPQFSILRFLILLNSFTL